jgi:alkylation response protein AidB-like acyl-CoA dehydrogenase
MAVSAEGRLGPARRAGPGSVRSLVFRSVDHVPAAAQAASTAWVSCGVACSGHGLRNLAAMMTRRSLMAMSSYLYARCLTIAGGTSEIARNQVAERILGLPRDPLLF